MPNSWTDPDEWERSRQLVAGYAALLAVVWLALDARALLLGGFPDLVAAAPGWVGPIVASVLIAWGLLRNAPMATLVGALMLAGLLAVSSVTFGPIPALFYWPFLVLLFLALVAEVGRARYGSPEATPSGEEG